MEWKTNFPRAHGDLFFSHSICFSSLRFRFFTWAFIQRQIFRCHRQIRLKISIEEAGKWVLQGKISGSWKERKGHSGEISISHRSLIQNERKMRDWIYQIFMRLRHCRCMNNFRRCHIVNSVEITFQEALHIMSWPT